ncbi:hypothetical protein GCM10009526_23660 [Glutamicibacter creatinolyticus]
MTTSYERWKAERDARIARAERVQIIQKIEEQRKQGVPLSEAVRPRRDLQPCGTVAAYQRHYRNREPVCDECKDAHRAYNRERAAIRNPDKKPRELKPCGTYPAYKRHLARRTEPCEPCREAWRTYQRAMRERKKL